MVNQKLLLNIGQKIMRGMKKMGFNLSKNHANFISITKSFTFDVFPSYFSVPNKRTCMPYSILTKLPPYTLLFGTASLSIF